MRLTVKQAAERTGLPEQTIRVWCQAKTCPFGEVVIDRKNRYGHRTYYICSERLELYLQGKGERV